MTKQLNKDKIAGEILSTYGISIKSTDEIIPFYGMLIDMDEKMTALYNMEKKTTSVSFQNEKQAFWFGFGKWLNITIAFSILIIALIVYYRSSKGTLPESFMKHSVLVTTKTKEGKTVTGYLLNKGDRENYKSGINYLPGKNDGTIIVPLE